MIESLLGQKGSLEFKLVLFIIGLIVALVIVNLLLDGIRRYIRGLDTAALGGIILWLGYKASSISFISLVTNLLYLIGGTLCAVGLLVFILSKMFGRKRKATKLSGPPMPEKHLANEPAGDKGEQAVDGKSAADVAEEAKSADA